MRRTIGLSLAHSFRVLSGNDDPGLGAAYAKHFGEHADRVMAELVCLYPGVADTIRDLRGRGLRTAIVSTKFRYRIEDILKRAELSGLVDVIVGGEDVAQHKPHPESLQRALRLLDVHPSRAVYVGDHPVDAQAAAAAQIPFVGVLTGATDAQAWAAFALLSIIADVTELPAMLDLHGSRRAVRPRARTPSSARAHPAAIDGAGAAVRSRIAPRAGLSKARAAMASIRIERVSKRYGAVEAVRDLSLVCADGELLALLGPSGCGKTSTLKMLAGIEDVTEGEIYFEDRPVTALDAAQRNVAMVFEDYALYPHLTVAQNIAFPLEIRGRPRDEIRRATEGALACSASRRRGTRTYGCSAAGRSSASASAGRWCGSPRSSCSTSR